MAGMSITVCLPGTAAGRVDEAVAEAMAPFQRDFARCEELNIWDHARICGGADGHGFPVLPGHESDPRILHDRPRSKGTVEPNLPGMCAGGPREILDFTLTRAEAEEIAGEAWDLWHALRALHSPAESRVSLHESTGQWDEDRYWSQPLVRAFDEELDALRQTRRAYRFTAGLLNLDEPVEDIGPFGRNEFMARHGRWVQTRRHVLTLGGWWYEVDDARLHGACNNPARCPHEPDVGEGFTATDAYLAGLPADALLINVHCHV
ncbi:hypothetical protein ACWC9U_32060 [Streptomyces sp. 900116325]